MNNRKILNKYFKEFINILDTKSDYYILNYYMNEVKNETGKEESKESKENKENNVEFNETTNKIMDSTPSEVIFSNPSSIFVAKNADHVPLPPPRDNPDSIYGVGEASRESIGVTDARDNAKIDEINIDIDDKNTCYIKNCKNCKNRISYKVNKVNINVEINSIK